MKIVHTIGEARAAVRGARAAGKTVGFVPTMGYLHRGHTSLVEVSMRESDYQVMSIFVNRIQFNDARDFATYPRELERDCSLASGAGVDLVFAPDEAEVYRDQRTHVDVQLLTDHLCGAARPGHFRGVFTVVSKLFNIVQPDVSVFGQKDIQQAVSIEKMVADLDFPVRIIVAPTVREEDGLAMSSRNKHLDAGQRKRALAIHGSLKAAEEMIRAGERAASKITASMRSVLEGGAPEKVDYITVASYADLQPLEELSEKCVIAVAAFFGATRLIDNMIVEKKRGGYECRY